jgi:transglutaminase-like putative cysteine protease
MNLETDSPLDAYLAPSEVIDFDHPEIQAFLRSRSWNSLDPIDRARATYHFVRDEVDHSADVGGKLVTCDASDVLRNRVGICYGKSHLLAALLRAQGVPAGLCYQRLTLFDDPKDGYAVHSLNAAYFEELGRWVRMDARGNKPGVDAQLDLENEKLAFAIRPEMGEIDYRKIHANPAPATIRVLRENTNAEEMYLHRLPERIE